MPNQPFEPTWESLKNYEVPTWYEDAKFGIFIHWGLYSVPAFKNEWYPRNMYRTGTPEFEHHIKTYGPHTEFGYKDFIPHFTAEKFNANKWIESFKAAGAKFVVPVAEHHDGFAMYDCSFSQWTAARMGPKRDIIGELAAAAKQHGLLFGVSSHRAEHWWFMDGGREFDSDVQNPLYEDFYGPAQPAPRNPGTETWVSRDWQPRPNARFLEDWLARTCELVDKYQPRLVWFDWWIEQIIFETYLQRFATYYYNRGLEWGHGVAINYKNEAFPEGAAVLDIERGQLSAIRTPFWQTDTALAKNSWGYTTGQEYKNVGDVIGDLIDIVSKNGALLLNIGPRPDGTIPEPEQEMLREIGQWLQINGEAIYETRPWKIYGEGPTEVIEGPFADTKRQSFTSQDFRFTTRGNTLYAITQAWPGEKAIITSLAADSPHLNHKIESVQILGAAGSAEWSQDTEGLHIRMPTERPCNHAFSFKITFTE